MKEDILEFMYLSSFIYRCKNKVIPGTTMKQLATELESDNEMKEFSSFIPLDGIVKFSFSNTRDLQAGITVNHVKKRITLVFRGSESWMDWYHNIIIKQKTLHDKVKVHYGVYMQLHHDYTYCVLKRNILRLYEENKDYRIYITGHSLGGSLATIFSYLFAKEFSQIQVKCITFASPRVGNKEFKHAYTTLPNVSHTRCFTCKDIVPALPCRGYYHVGDVIKLCETKIINEVNKKDLKLFSKLRNVKEHACSIYAKRLLMLQHD